MVSGNIFVGIIILYMIRFYRFKKIIVIIVAALLPLCLTSCEDDSIKKDGLLYGEVVGELYHTQYWNSNDNWDLKNMYLILHYEDGSIERVDANDSNAYYTFSPISPNGLPLGNTSFKLESGYYLDYKNKKHEIKTRTFEGAYIINNPNNVVKDDTSFVIFRVLIEILVASTSLIFLVVLLLRLVKNKKYE